MTIVTAPNAARSNTPPRRTTGRPLRSSGATLVVAAVVAVASSAAVTGTARAAVTYTNRATFNAGLGAGSYTESFDSLAEAGQGTMTKTFGTGPYAFTASTGAALPNDNDLFRAELSATDFALSSTIPSNLTFTFAGGNVTAVGGDFSMTDTNFRAAPDTFTLTLSDGTTVTRTSGGTNTPFFGFASAVPITSLTFTVPADATPNNYFATVNNFTVGAAVPEPATVGAVAVAGVAGLVRRRRRRA